MVSLAFGFISALANAEPAMVHYSSDGDRYDVTCNEHGYVLRSIDALSRLSRSGGSKMSNREPLTIYMGRDCDVYSPELGSGAWCWANGGFLVEITKVTSIGFPRQDLDCPIDAGLGAWCQCN